MRLRPLFIAALLFTTAATHADQAEWMTKDIAEKVDKLVDYGMELRHFCPPCGDKAYRHEVVAMKDVQEMDTAGQFSVVINDLPIDLAYTYIEKDGKWSNLGKLAGAKVDSVPDTLPADIGPGLPDFDRMAYVGLIDNKLAVTMQISKNGNELTGTYWYSHVGAPLNLSGETDQLGAFTLNETNDEAKKTGVFSGKLTENAAKMEGTWLSEDGAKKLSFALRRVALYGEENGTLTAGTQGSETHMDFPVFLAAYGPAYAAVNEAIQTAVRARYTEYAAQFASTAAELGLDDATHFGDDLGQTISVGDHEILLANENVVSVLFTISLYQGGAHGMTMSFPLNLRVSKSGEAYKTKPIALTELLKPGADALKALNTFLLAELKKKEASLVVNGEIKDFKLEDVDNFTLAPKGITVYFDPYAVASYADGPYQVFVPFSEANIFSADALKDIVETAPVAAPAK